MDRDRDDFQIGFRLRACEVERLLALDLVPGGRKQLGTGS